MLTLAENILYWLWRQAHGWQRSIDTPFPPFIVTMSHDVPRVFNYLQTLVGNSEIQTQMHGPGLRGGHSRQFHGKIMYHAEVRDTVAVWDA